jgi:uncharacterized protein (TIGR02099 family)
MKIGGVCFFCIKKMWQVLAILLVITAVIISVLKYTLPHIGGYRENIQDWVRTQYGAEIYIGNISAGWEGNGPTILLQNISFLPNESAPLDLVIKETRVKLDFWQSIKTLQLTSDYFILDGVVATVDGRSLIKTSDSQSDAPILDALSRLFLGQLQQFSVVNSEVNLNTPSEVVQHISIEELTWYNDKLHHQGVGQFKLGDFAANSLSFVLDLQGAKRADLSGQLYVEATELDISPWLHQIVSSKSAIEKSNVNFKSWATIENGLVDRAHINLGDNEIVWAREDKTHRLQFGQGQMIWIPAVDGWEITSNDIQFAGDDSDWPKVNFNLKKESNLFNFYFSQWSGQRTISLLSLIDIDAGVTKALDTYQPQGMIHDFYIEFEDAADWKLTGLFADLGWQNVKDVPGANNLTGHFGMTPKAGWLKIEGVDGYLQTGSLLPDPIYYENFDVSLDFVEDAKQNWQLFGHDIWLHNNDIDVVAEFSLDFGDATIATYAEISGSDLKMADKYYPPEYIGQPAIDYLNGAIKAGSLDVAQLVWSGKASAFPYDNNEGIFLVNTLVSDVDFLFEAGWPVLSNVDGTLIFRNDSLTIFPQKGYFLDVDIADKAVAVIPSLSKSERLELDINADVEPSKMTKLFNASPLRDIFNPVFEQISIKSTLSASSRIVIPLVGNALQFDENLEYEGVVTFADNAVDIATPGISLTNVSGQLKFNKQKIWTEGFEARWFDQPLQVKLEGRQALDDYLLAIKSTAQINAEQLLTTLDDPFKAYIKGQIPVETNIALSFPKVGVRYGVEVKADLTGTALDLPMPYNKAIDVSAPLTLNIKGDEISSLITANYDKRLFFNGILPNEQPAFSQAHLILADQDLGLAGDGFKISVDLESAQIMPWYDFVDSLVEGAGKQNGPALLPVPGLIAGKVGQLAGFGQQLNGVNFELTEGNGSWDLSLNARETRTVAHIDRDWNGKGITIRTDYLRLTTTDEEDAQDEEGAESSVTNSAKLIASLPPIDFTCIDCQFNQYNLKRVDIETTTAKDTLNITKFNISKGKHQFQATGQWFGGPGNGLSAFSGRLTSDDIGNLLNEYELTAMVKDSDAKLDVIANWAGGPHQFNLPSLSGEIKWSMGEGHLTEVSDRGSRILSLLSIDSLVRKLRLDFRDVFGEGFFYNSMKGSMLIDSGIAYTDNTEIDGVPGDLNLQGKVNLVDQTLDYSAAFYPKLTSSLPVIIGYMVNPITGIAALALDKMLESTKVVAQVHFTITGVITEPVITEIERTTRDYQLPKNLVRPVIVPSEDFSSPKKFAEPEPLLPEAVEPNSNKSTNGDSTQDDIGQPL